MSREHEGVYLPTSDPDTFESTPLANAGWYEEGQHGGAVAALMTARAEAVPTLTAMEISRVTVELFRVVPLIPLTCRARVIREGKRIQVISVDVTDSDGTLMAHGTIQRLRLADRPTPSQERVGLHLPLPDSPEVTPLRDWGHGAPHKTMFHHAAIEARRIYGGFTLMGPGAIWVRVHTPIVAGTPLSPAQRAVAVADFCNGASRELDDRWVFMNTDLSVHIGRYPAGEWTALEAVSHYADRGRGVAAGTIWDETGWVGRSAQSLYLDRR